MKNIKIFSLIALLTLVFLAAPVGNAFSKDEDTDYDSLIAEAESKVAPAKQKLDEAKKELEAKQKEMEDAIRNGPEKAKNDAIQTANNEYDARIAAAQKAVDECKANCAELYANLAQLKGLKQKAIDDANEKYEKAKKEKENQYKDSLKKAEKKVKEAQKEYDEAVKNVEKAKNNKTKSEEKEVKEDKKAKEKAEKDLANAQKDLEKAKKEIEKKCNGENYDKKKCENAQKSMTKAEKDIADAQKRINDYYTKYPDEKPSDSSSPSPDADTSGEEGSSQDSGKPTKSADDIAEEYAKKQEASNKANEKYNEAVGKYANAEKGYYDAAFLCSQGDKKACTTMEEKKDELAKLQAEADQAYAEKLKADDELNAFLQEYPTANLSGKKNNYDSLNAKVDNLQNQYEQATANCKAIKDKNKFYRTPDGTMMTGNDFCDLADSLKDQLEQAKKDRDAAKKAYDEEFESLNDEQKGYHLMASEGEINEGIYVQDSDVFKNVTRRAARILVWLRPVVYLFAAFGLVGFAFAAVFNKISWKWFGNIAIGLFLVANMGRLVEYMVYPTGKDSDSPAGIENTVAASPLSSFGDNLEDHRLTKVLADATYGFVEPVAIYEPTPPKAEVTPNIEEVPDEEVPIEEKTKFCRGGGFTGCVSDIVNFIKNATNTIDTIKRTATNLGSAGKGIVSNLDNIVSLIKNMNPLSPKQMVNSLGQISTNINQAMNSLKGAMNNMSGADDQIAEIWGAEAGENGLDKARKTINNAINSMGNIKKGIDNAINAVSGLVNVLGF